tara:strand:+ start:51 stop:1124 length:1074 start_codon:yes stop_codon:yes gene_type:complete
MSTFKYCDNVNCAEYAIESYNYCSLCVEDYSSDTIKYALKAYNIRKNLKKNKVLDTIKYALKSYIIRKNLKKNKALEIINASIKMKIYKSINYLTHDGNVTKYTLKKSNNLQPKIDQVVIVHYTGMLLNNSKFDSSYDRNEPFKFTLGDSNIIELWNIALQYMSKNETAIITGSSDYCYKDLNMPGIPPNSTLKFKITLLDFYDKIRPMEELTHDEKVELLYDFKKKGNNKLLEKNYSESLYLYKESLNYALNINHSETINIYNNLSLTLLKLEDYKNSKNYANLAYNIDNTNIKALYKLSLISYKLNNYNDTNKYADKILDLEPDNIDAKKLISNCIHKKIENINKQKTFYKKMFA